MKANAQRNYERHSERFKRTAEKWRQSNPAKRSAIMAFENAKRRSRKAANGGRGFTKAHWRELLRRTNGFCVYCRKLAASSIDHFVPLARGGQDDYANIVPACRHCNSLKRSNDPVEWITATYGVESLVYVRSIMLT